MKINSRIFFKNSGVFFRICLSEIFMKRMSICFFVLFILISVNKNSQASPFTLVTPNTGKVTINVTYKDGSTAVATGQDNGAYDENNDLGKFTFTPIKQKEVDKIDIVNEGAINNNTSYNWSINSYDFGIYGIDYFEDNFLPSFTSNAEGKALIILINVYAVLTSDDQYEVGQIFSVTDGKIDQSDSIKIFDASTLFQEDDLLSIISFLNDAESINELPLYNGFIEVTDLVQIVPEPSTLGLFSIGVGILVVFNFAKRKLLKF